MKRIRMSAPRQFVCNDSNPVAKLIKVTIKVFRYEKTLTMQYSPLILLSVLINISQSTNWTDLSEDLVLSDNVTELTSLSSDNLDIEDEEDDVGEAPIDTGRRKGKTMILTRLEIL